MLSRSRGQFRSSKRGGFSGVVKEASIRYERIWVVEDVCMEFFIVVGSKG